MTEHIELKAMNQGTALATGTLALPSLVTEGLKEFKDSFDRLCLQAGSPCGATTLFAASSYADDKALSLSRKLNLARSPSRWGQ